MDDVGRHGEQLERGGQRVEYRLHLVRVRVRAKG